MVQLRHFDGTGTARFVTITCFRREQYLTATAAKNILLQGLAYLRNQRQIKILGWVLMPEHVHLVLLPHDDVKLGYEIGQMKGWTAREILSQVRHDDRVVRRSDGHAAVWERRCYDHNCRTPDNTREKIIYCHNNPVTRGLVSDPSQWRWSSYNWYRGEGDMTLEIDGIDL
jgi:putative transposase